MPISRIRSTLASLLLGFAVLSTGVATAEVAAAPPAAQAEALAASDFLPVARYVQPSSDQYFYSILDCEEPLDRYVSIDSGDVGEVSWEYRVVDSDGVTLDPVVETAFGRGSFELDPDEYPGYLGLEATVADGDGENVELLYLARAEGDCSKSPASFTVPGSFGQYLPVEPVSARRLLDTRTANGAATVDGRFLGDGRVGAEETITIDVAGRAGVPGGAAAAMLNVTAVNPAAGGFLTVFGCDGSIPLASSVNFAAGVTTPNAVFTELDASGRVCVYSNVPTDVVIDVNGAVPTDGSPVAVSPARLFETRPGPLNQTVDGQFRAQGRVPADEVVTFDVVGRGDVTEARAAVFNFTAFNASDRGFITVWGCGVVPEGVSQLNIESDAASVNAVFSELSAQGAVCLRSTVETDLVVDVNGFVPPEEPIFDAIGIDETNPEAVPTARLLETREGTPAGTVDGVLAGTGRVAAGETVAVQVAGRGGVPDEATAALVNVIAINPPELGFLTVSGCDSEPTTSTVNAPAFSVVSNAAFTDLNAAGELCVYASVDIDIVIDVDGFVEPFSEFHAIGELCDGTKSVLKDFTEVPLSDSRLRVDDDDGGSLYAFQGSGGDVMIEAQVPAGLELVFENDERTVNRTGEFHMRGIIEFALTTAQGDTYEYDLEVTTSPRIESVFGPVC